MDLRDLNLAGSHIIQTASGRTAGRQDSGEHGHKGRDDYGPCHKAQGSSNSKDEHGYSDSRDEPRHGHRAQGYSNSGEGSGHAKMTQSYQASDQYSWRIGGNSATCRGSEGKSKCPPFELKDTPSSKYAFLALKPIANKWKTIGTLLDLPSGKLDSIQVESHWDDDRMREMVDEWLKTLDATWEDLIAAVKVVNETRASEIEHEYIYSYIAINLLFVWPYELNYLFIIRKSERGGGGLYFYFFGINFRGFLYFLYIFRDFLYFFVVRMKKMNEEMGGGRRI